MVASAAGGVAGREQEARVRVAARRKMKWRRMKGGMGSPLG
jgi:hypothetical protein